MNEIKLQKHFVAFVDDCDLEKVSGYSWYAWKNNSSKTYYCVANTPMVNGVRGKRVYMHRLLLDPKHGMQVDHADMNGLNNSRSNIRVCTPSQNMTNMKKRDGCKSEHRGVSKSRCGKWIAYISKKHIGTFDNEVEAALAYNEKSFALYGDFAVMNKVGEME